jgi:hypothetical protein
MICDARQHGCDRQGVASIKPRARMRAHHLPGRSNL